MLTRRVEALESALAQVEARLDLVQGGTDKASNWSPAGFPVLDPGTRVDATDGLRFSSFLASGWWNVERWGAWGRDQKHLIRLHIRAYGGGYVDMFLVLQAFQPPGADRQEVHITANGLFLGRHDLRATPRMIRLRLPPPAIDNGDVILYLQTPEPKSPAAFGESEDQRALGAGLVALGLY